MAHTDPALIVRMPAELKSWLADFAKSNDRTMTSQIVQLVKAAKNAQKETA